jgi:hypothetical protein
MSILRFRDALVSALLQSPIPPDLSVVGICVCRGGLDGSSSKDTGSVAAWFEKAGIHLVFRTAGGSGIGCGMTHFTQFKSGGSSHG